ncbi:MAG: monofunctional biosynthetic peptidoglycan transglycosylase [Geminicoccaceae bacterium]|nr:monofunctional biosynthetic peptidoglycan transglycosylase [Geminicoccaceae bacterium]
MRRRTRVLWAILLALLVGPPALLAAYRFLPPPGTPLMLVRAFQGLGTDYRWRPLLAISPHLARAVIASEDNLFCRHWGFDLDALHGEIDRAIRGRRPRGASTITQQTAKNLLLWPGRDVARKLAEAWLAPQLELVLGKRRILELYLNVAEWAPGVYGAEAAAWHWYDKPAADLTPREAARLAVILPNPLHWTPKGQAGRARSIERRVGQLGPLLDCAP